MRDVPLVPALALVLAVVVVATAAAGLTASSGAGDGQASDEGLGIGEGSGMGAGDGNGTGLSAQEPSSDRSLLPSAFWSFLEAVAILALVAGVVMLVVVVWREGLSGLLSILRSVLGSVLLAGFLMVGLVALMYLFSVLQGDGGGGFVGGGSLPESLGEQGGSVTTSPAIDPPMALLAVGALVVVAILALASTDALPSPGDAVDAADPPEPQADGSTVSLPVDASFTDVGPTNPVYRAWLALADRVDDANRGTSTPGEVANAAIADGIDPDAVDTLTQLFTEVRYGRRPVDADRAERARAARDVIDDQTGS